MHRQWKSGHFHPDTSIGADQVKADTYADNSGLNQVSHIAKQMSRVIAMCKTHKQQTC
jgi:hypothetical protein